MKTLSIRRCIVLGVIQTASCYLPCPERETVNITDGRKFNNDSVFYNGVEYRKGFWMDTEEMGHALRLGCACTDRVCVWKCCPPKQMFVDRQCASADEASDFSPTVFAGKSPTGVEALEHFFFMHSELCEDRYLVDSGVPDEEIYLQKDGSLEEVSNGRWQRHPAARFCVETMRDQSGTRLVAAVCYPEETPPDDSPLLYTAYGIGLLLSVPFLLATFAVYACNSELRNLHGLCLLAYCAGLLLAYPLLAFLKLHTWQAGKAHTTCLVIAFIVYYAFQTSFFWLNVMCFDIWRTFSGFRVGGASKRAEARRFTLYGTYAWGVPLVLAACVAAAQFAYLPDNFVKPRFAERRCWFESWLSELLYFYAPVLVLVACNAVLFAVTALRIQTIQRETAILKGADSSRTGQLTSDQQRFSLYLKLFMVMGVNWAVEVIGFAVGGSNWYWMVIDVSNIALGFFIFLIFVWKNKVRSILQRKWQGRSGTWRPRGDLGRWASRSSAAATEDTRVTDDAAIRLKDLRR